MKAKLLKRVQSVVGEGKGRSNESPKAFISSCDYKDYHHTLAGSTIIDSEVTQVTQWNILLVQIGTNASFSVEFLILRPANTSKWWYHERRE